MRIVSLKEGDLMPSVEEKIVLVGGGSGVSALARHLKNIRRNVKTVQTVFDRGGHSGWLRDNRGIVALGDLRRTILAMSDRETSSLIDVFLGHRFEEVKPLEPVPLIQKKLQELDPAASRQIVLDNFSLGNLNLLGCIERYGGLVQALDVVSEWGGIGRGKILPVSLDDADILARNNAGEIIPHEGALDGYKGTHITSIWLSKPAHIYTGAYEAILEADKFVIVSGSHYGSVLANFLVDGFPEAVRRTKAKIIMVVNMMTEPYLTDGFKASKFVKEAHLYFQRKIDVVICNDGKFSKETLRAYASKGAFPVEVDLYKINKYAHKVITADLVEQAEGAVRHSKQLAHVIAKEESPADEKQIYTDESVDEEEEAERVVA